MAQEATAFLQKQHDEVRSLFGRFEKAEGEERKQIANEISDKLIVHTKLEEEIFYPAVKKAGKESAGMIEESLEEHYEIDELLSHLSGLSYLNDEFDRLMTEVIESVEHHVSEEETEMFPMVRRELADLEELGREMTERMSDINPGHIRNEWAQRGVE